MKGLKYIYVLSEFKHKNCLLLTEVICYSLHFKFLVSHFQQNYSFIDFKVFCLLLS